MRAPASVGQEAAASEDEHAQCLLCSRKNPGSLGNTMLNVEEKKEEGRERKEKAKEINASRSGGRH